MRRAPWSHAVLAVLLATLLTAPARAVVLQAGDLVVTGQNGAGPFVARVDVNTGANQIISQGGLITAPTTVAVPSNGFIYVGNPVGTRTDFLKINPVTGAQTLFASVTGLLRPQPLANMIAHTDGYLYFTGFNSELVRLDPASGVVTQVTTGLVGIGVTEGRNGQVYVSNCIDTNGDLSCDVLVRKVDRFTGAFTTAGSNVNGSIGKPRDIAFVRGDSMYVESANDRRLFRFNPNTTAAGAVPLFGNELSYTVQHMVGHPDDNLYLTHNYTEGRVDRIDPVFNTRSSFSIFTAPSSVVGITVVRDWSVPAQRSTWGQLKQIYR